MRMVYCDACGRAHGWPVCRRAENRQLAYCDTCETLDDCNDVPTRHIIRRRLGDNPIAVMAEQIAALHQKIAEQDLLFVE